MSSCKIIAFCSFDLLVAFSVTVVVVWAPHYHYNVVRTKARKTRPKKKKLREGARNLGRN